MAKEYKPKRASQRWLEGAPEYVRSCFDSGGKYSERYTVTFCGSLWEPSMGRKVQMLGMSAYPSHPQGISLWGEVDANWGPSHQKVRWLDLPESIRNHVIARATEE